MTEQPCLGTTLLTPVGEGARKGALKIVCFTTFLAGLPRPVGSPLCGQKHRKLNFNFGAWNVRTLLDSDSNERPERRTAFVARALRKFNVDIAALSETRLAEEGQLREEKGGYTFFWKGRPAGEPRIHGVGFAIKNNLVRQLTELPQGISERLMTVG